MKKLLITVNGVTYEVDVEVVKDDDSVSYGAPYMPAPVAAPVAPPPAPVAPAPAAPKAAAPSSGAGLRTVNSPLPGVVKAVKVKAGDSVKGNTPLVVLEAMKMETNISAPADGVVKEVKVQVGQNVQQNEVLVVFA